MAELRSRCAVFEHYESDEIGGLTMKESIAIGGGAKVAWFKDSEGNIMALIEELPQIGTF